MLPVLPPPVRISVVYPLQPLLYIPMNTRLRFAPFLSGAASYSRPTVAVHILTLSRGVHYF